MKRHIKRYANSLYCSHKVRSGGAWKTPQFLGHGFLKKLTHVTRLTKTSLICVKIRLTNTFSTTYFFNRPLVPSSTNSWLEKI